MTQIYNAQERLSAHWSALQNQWQAARREWRDSMGDRFEREFWREWENTMPIALKAMAELDSVLDQALLNTR